MSNLYNHLSFLNKINLKLVKISFDTFLRNSTLFTDYDDDLTKEDKSILLACEVQIWSNFLIFNKHEFKFPIQSSIETKRNSLIIIIT